MKRETRPTKRFPKALSLASSFLVLMGALTLSPRAEALTPVETQAVIKAINTVLNSGAATGKYAAELWEALAYYQGSAGTLTETNIVLHAATEAELGLGASSSVYQVVQIGLYGVIIGEVAVLGYEGYLLWHYTEEIDGGLDEYIEMSEEMGQTAMEAEEEYYEDLYEENGYWDNFCDLYWCP